MVAALSALLTFQLLLLGTYCDDEDDDDDDVDDDDDDDDDDDNLRHHGIYQISHQGHIADKAEEPRGSLGWLWRIQCQDQV